MSYCVNCGVELDDSQKCCPLCHVPVQNPVNPWKEPASAPYPRMVERVMKTIDRRYGALLATIALSVPVICSVLIDILFTHHISWSGYVTGGAACIFIWLLLPMLLKKPNVYLHILYNAVVLALYIADILYINNDMRSFFMLGAPLVLAATGFTYAVTPVLLSPKLTGKLYKPAIILFMLPVLCIVTELIIDLYAQGVFLPTWSLIASAPCIVSGLALIELEKKKKLKDKIIRRLFL